MSWSIKELDEVKGFTVEWGDSEIYILSRLNKLYVSKNLERPFKHMYTFRTSGILSLLSHLRILQRFFRFMFYNVIKLPTGGIFVTFQKQAGLYKEGKFHPVKGMDRPSRFLRGACAVDQAGGVYLGEYLSNPDRGPVKIYYLPPDSIQLEVVYEFQSHMIRHIHGLFYDQYEDCIWCTSGDMEKECKILKTNDSFVTVELVGEGDETWRTVSVLFTEDGIYYGMDGQFCQNYIYRIDRKTKERTQLSKVDGPVYYSKKIDGRLFFGVTAEGCPSQSENVASLWCVSHDGQVERVIGYGKDFLPNRVFMPGTIHFTLGPERDNKLLLYCLGLKGVDGKTLQIT
ncbi:MAG: hypothetical protein ACE5GV_00060 [Candidatus Scalindua sp.]